MSFRDDHEAALHRMSALERELAETKTKLADAEAEAAAASEPEPEPEPAPEPEPTPKRALRPMPSEWTAGNDDRAKSGMHIERAGPLLTATWFGLGTGNFITWSLMFVLPTMTLISVGVLISRGIPTQPPAVAWWKLIALLVVALWNTAALAANHRNRVTVTASTLTILQGYVPWPVAFRRRRIALKDIDALEVERDWDPETEATDYRVLAVCGGRRTRVTGAVSEAKAQALSTALASAIGVPLGRS